MVMSPVIVLTNFPVSGSVSDENVPLPLALVHDPVPPETDQSPVSILRKQFARPVTPGRRVG